MCVHGCLRYSCTQCKGKGVCEHGRQRRLCKTCVEAQFIASMASENQCAQTVTEKNSAHMCVDSITFLDLVYCCCVRACDSDYQCVTYFLVIEGCTDRIVTAVASVLTCSLVLSLAHSLTFRCVTPHLLTKTNSNRPYTHVWSFFRGQKKKSVRLCASIKGCGALTWPMIPMATDIAAKLY